MLPYWCVLWDTEAEISYYYICDKEHLLYIIANITIQLSHLRLCVVAESYSYSCLAEFPISAVEAWRPQRLYLVWFVSAVFVSVKDNALKGMCVVRVWSRSFTVPWVYFLIVWECVLCASVHVCYSIKIFQSQPEGLSLWSDSSSSLWTTATMLDSSAICCLVCGMASQLDELHFCFIDLFFVFEMTFAVFIWSNLFLVIFTNIHVSQHVDSERSQLWDVK